MARKKGGLGGMLDDLVGDIPMLGDDHDDTRSSGNKGGRASHRSHSGHQLTDADRSKGGKASAAKQDMRELGRKGGKA